MFRLDNDPDAGLRLLRCGEPSLRVWSQLRAYFPLSRQNYYTTKLLLLPLLYKRTYNYENRSVIDGHFIALPPFSVTVVSLTQFHKSTI